MFHHRLSRHVHLRAGVCAPALTRPFPAARTTRACSHIGAATLGFHRLAIMGLTPEGMQPFELDGSYVVCNGEIYGFRAAEAAAAAKGYTFRSDSDCEILLPLYREYGAGHVPRCWTRSLR